MLRFHSKGGIKFKKGETPVSVSTAEQRKIIRNYLVRHKIIFQGGLVLLLFLAAALMSCFASLTEERPALVLETAEEEVQTSETTLSSQTDEASSEIFVYVCGAVTSPGVVCLNSGDRLIDAVNAAGGLRDDADLNQINLARPAVDGEQITVLTRDEVQAMAVQPDNQPNAAAQSTGTQAETSQQGSLININTATASQLKELPGIGEVIAENIVRYREENGLFASIEEIKEVSRIGDKIFESIKDLICV